MKVGLKLSFKNSDRRGKSDFEGQTVPWAGCSNVKTLVIFEF